MFREGPEYKLDFSFLRVGLEPLHLGHGRNRYPVHEVFIKGLERGDRDHLGKAELTGKKAWAVVFYPTLVI